MRYVKHFDINGVNARQVACIELHGAPNAATEGAVGVLGIDVDSPAHQMYKCVAVKGSIYTWEACEGNSSGGSGDIQTLDEMLQGFERDPGSVKKYVDSVAGSGGGTGEDGGYYTPDVTDNENGTMTVSFTASKSGMATVAPVTVDLPAGAHVTGIVEMGGDATRSTYRMRFSDGSGYDFDVYHGVSATHTWSGTTLTITSASGTSSANLKGGKGDKGDTGADGYTPIRGTDYWTDADKAQMVSDVLAALESSEEVAV